MGELIPLFPLGSPLFPGMVLPLQIFEPRYRRLVHDLIDLPPGSPRRFFGVVAIRQGWEVDAVAPAAALYDVGCTARLQSVLPQPDGRFRLVTVGGERFRLLDVVGDDPPYLQGEVEWLAEEEVAEEAAATADGLVGRGDDAAAAVARDSMALLARGVRDLFTRYVDAVAALRGGGWAPGDDEDLDPDLADPSGGPERLTAGAQSAELLRVVADDPRALSWLVASAALLTPEDRQALLAVSATRRRLAAESRLLRRELTILQTLGTVPVPLQEFATPMTVN